MATGNRQLQNRAGANVPSRSILNALVRAQVPRVLLEDALGDQLVAECPPDALLFTSGRVVGAVDFGMALGTSGPGLAGSVILVDAQGVETVIAPIAAATGALSGIVYGGTPLLGSIALSPGEQLIYRPTAATAGTGFFAPSLYYADPGPGGVQQSVVDLSDGAVHTLFEAPPGKNVQFVPFGDAIPASGGCSLTVVTDIATAVDFFLSEGGVDYNVLAAAAVAPPALNPVGSGLCGAAQLILSPGQSLRAQRVGAAATVKARSVFQFFNAEDAE